MSKTLTSDWGNRSAAPDESEDRAMEAMISDGGMLENLNHEASSAEDGRPESSKPNNHGLPSRNVVIDGKRTSIRLDSDSLDSLLEIATRERISISELCTQVFRRNQGKPFTFTAALRIFMLSYYRAAATEDGHKLAGHGSGPNHGQGMPSSRADRSRLRKRSSSDLGGTDAAGESATS